MSKRRWKISDDEYAEILEVRAALHRGGYEVLPADEEGKRPAFAGWPAFLYDPNDPEPVIPRTKNGDGHPTKAPHFATGAKTSELVSVDIDVNDRDAAQRARVAYEEIAGHAGCVRTRPNSSRVMLLYRAGPDIERLAINAAAAGVGAIEIDGNHPGQFVMLHGRHPSGVMVTYEGDAPWEVPVSELPTVNRHTCLAAHKAATDAIGVKSLQYDGRTQLSGQGTTCLPARRSPTGAVHALVDIITARSITPSAIEFLRQLCFEFNPEPIVLAEEMIRAAVEAGIELNPSEASRYENLLRQMDPARQRVTLQAAMERKWMEHADQIMTDGYELRAETARHAQWRRERSANRKKIDTMRDERLREIVERSITRLGEKHLDRAFALIATRLHPKDIGDAIAFLEQQRKGA